MFCRRMHLTERRIQPPRIVTEGPIVRPCSDWKRERERSQHEQTAAHIQLLNKSKLLETPTKTPLMIIDLDISPEAKTLVQKNVKKDPKKPPPFCKQYQSASRYAFFNDPEQKSIIPNFCIKGIVFNQSSKSSNDSNTNDDDMMEETQHHTSSTNSGTVTPDPSDDCDSLPDNLSLEGYHHNCVNACQVSEYILNLDNYGMDKDGRLPGMTRSPTPQPILPHRAPPSPSTQQIIRVDVTVNRDKHQEHDKAHSAKQTPTGLSNRPLIRDKRGKLKFNSSYNI